MVNADFVDNVRRMSKLKRKPAATFDARLQDRFRRWLEEQDRPVSDASDAIESLAWAYASPRLTGCIEPASWRSLLGQLLTSVEEASVGNLGIDGWSQLLVSGELPLVLAYQFPELPDCRRLAKQAVQFISESLEEWFDGQGMPHANQLPNVRPLLATLTRSIRLSQAMKGVPFPKSALTEFAWFVQQALRLTRCDLTSAMSSTQTSPSRKSFTDLFQAAVSLTQDKLDAVLLESVLHANSPKSVTKPKAKEMPAEPSYQSDWSDVAVLQPDWSPRQPRLVVGHDDRKLQGELTIGKQIVFSGDLMPTVAIDGKTATVNEAWECVCWYTDDDIDLMEVRTSIADGWQLERQFLMAREDQFLFIADSVIGDEPAAIDYTGPLPLSSGVEFQPNSESNEGFLVAKSRLGLVLPLSLPEWRRAPVKGGLVAGTNGMELNVSAKTDALYAPLFIDLHRRRMQTTPTWRQLTVADRLQIAGDNEAVAYRIQVGIEQWVVYRSMKPSISRTFLGHHTVSEYTFGRFLNDGTMETLVEIDAEPLPGSMPN